MNIEDEICVGNIVIFRVDEWGDGRKSEFDGHVISMNEKGVDVVYLSGYRSRNDFIEWEDIVAKVDKRRTWVKLKTAPLSPLRLAIPCWSPMAA